VTVRGKIVKVQPTPNLVIVRTDKGQEWVLRPEAAVALRVNGKEIRQLTGPETPLTALVVNGKLNELMVFPARRCRAGSAR
jgi:hypothetical protein